MAAAAIPLIEIGLQEAPQLITLGMSVINGLKLMFHKAPTQKFSPTDVATVQAMSLSGFKTKLASDMPETAKTLNDSQLTMFLEMLYQVQKDVTRVVATTQGVVSPQPATPSVLNPTTPTMPTMLPTSTDAIAMLIGKAALTFLGPLLSQITMSIPAATA